MEWKKSRHMLPSFAIQLHHSRLPIEMSKRILKPSDKGRLFAEEHITANKKRQHNGDSNVTGTSTMASKRARPAHASGPMHSGEAAHVLQCQETAEPHDPCPQSPGIDDSDAASDVVEVEPPVASETPEEELAHLQKDWTSPVYAFFNLIPTIREIDGRCVHKFACSAHGCKVKVHQYLDAKDAQSTGNMRKHVKLCWGTEVLDAADNTKDASEVCTNIIGSI
ncbi:hypothetical protein BS17DRAFT_763599 [Gyrodon lividus]|nr:hypothetical protein BS17DRAFT_763599 [Gyrodon lividus]